MRIYLRLSQLGSCIFSFVIMNTAFPHSDSIVDMILLLRVLKHQRVTGLKSVHIVEQKFQGFPKAGCPELIFTTL